VALLDLPARALLDRFAARDPTPGGGSAAALAGALAAALVSMVCAMDKTRSGEGSERARLDTAGAGARDAGERLRSLVDEDTAAYESVMDAYRLPKGSDEEKARRKQAVAAALAHATEVPRRTAESCLAVLRAAAEAAAVGNPNALSDAKTAGALAFAGLLGALENVKINLGPNAEPSALAKVDALRDQARKLSETLGLA
jgi:formiminotetrahydrofolate cyclodeaminase